MSFLFNNHFIRNPLFSSFVKAVMLLMLLFFTPTNILCNGGNALTSPVKEIDRLFFIQNKGQWNKNALFGVLMNDAAFVIEKKGFCYLLGSPENYAHEHHHNELYHKHNIDKKLNYHIFRAHFLNSDSNVLITGSNPKKSITNYYVGNTPDKWASGVQSFGTISYLGLYKGIDMHVNTIGNEFIKYDFIVNPHINTSVISIEYDGIDSLWLHEGNLLFQTSVGNIMEQKPVAFQMLNGKKVEVKCKFKCNGNRVSFDFPEGYDKSNGLIIDPTIVFSSYTGSTQENWGFTATYDNAGNFYLGGIAMPSFQGVLTGYPTTNGAFQTTYAGGQRDIAISKFSSDGSTLLYSTYLGGDNNDTPHSMVVDANNNLIVYGVSYSPNFPTTLGAYSTSNSGNGDIIISKFNPSGTALLGSTFMGGSGRDGMNFDPTTFNAGNLKVNYGDQHRGEINVDAAGNIYVASCTASPNFPTTSGALQAAIGGTQDGCAFKLNSSCTQLVYSTFIGGTNDDACYSLDITANGTIYVAGGTMSSNFPATAGSLNTTYSGGNFDGFVAHINANATQLLASTFIGTNGNDQVYFVKLDGSGNVYVTGQTTGSYPVFNAPYSNPNSGQFITKLNPSLGNITYSTVFGNGSGEPNISPTAFLVDECENVYVAGWGCSAGGFFDQLSPLYRNEMLNMPLTPNAFQSTTDGTDFYFFVLNKDVQSLLYATYFGGAGDGFTTGYEHVDGGTSRFDRRGVIYQAVCAGCQGTSLTPTTPGVWSTVNGYNQGCNALGIKIAFNFINDTLAITASNTQGCAPLTVNFQTNIQNPQSIVWDFGNGNTSTLNTPAFTFNSAGTYNVRAIVSAANSCNGLPDTANIIITVINGLNAQITATDTQGCAPLTVNFQTNIQNPQSIYWDFGNGNTSNQVSPIVVFPTPGLYAVRVIVTDSISLCGNFTDTASYNVTVLANNVVANFILSDDTTWLGQSFNVTNTSVNYDNFYWDFDDGVVINDLSPVQHQFSAEGNYEICLTASAKNCFDTLCKPVYVIATRLIGVPNGFSPNNDGINDILYVEGVDIEKLLFRIYNRWGELVFESTDKSVGWDGFYKGKLQEMDVYVYVVDAILFSGKNISLKGNVSLLK
jgi:gliding motility-associated-like protein